MTAQRANKPRRGLGFSAEEYASPGYIADLQRKVKRGPVRLRVLQDATGWSISRLSMVLTGRYRIPLWEARKLRRAVVAEIAARKGGGV